MKKDPMTKNDTAQTTVSKAPEPTLGIMENTDQKRTVYTVKMVADEGFNEDYNVTSETSKCCGFAIKLTCLGKQSGTYNNWKIGTM
jgi:hypothetical protein